MSSWKRLLAAACITLAVALSPPPPARAQPQGGSSADAAASRPSVDEICRTLAQAAADNELPEEFFTRLIWQESRFDPAAVSPAGAQGIAQFMPQTAAMRGLTNAFEPLQALRESASYLRELRTTFRGNLGLAAAAYNAGPGQVEAWLARRRALPAETQAYVRIVTGYAAEAWTSKSPPQVEASAAPPSNPRWARAASRSPSSMIERTRRRPDLTANPAWGPWGVQLAGNWSEGRRPRRLRAAAPQVRRRSGRPAAAGPGRAPACGLDVPRPGLGKEPDGRGRAVCEAAGRRRRLHRSPQPAQLRPRQSQVRPAASRPVTFPESAACTRRLCPSA